MPDTNLPKGTYRVLAEPLTARLKVQDVIPILSDLHEPQNVSWQRRRVIETATIAAIEAATTALDDYLNIRPDEVSSRPQRQIDLFYAARAGRNALFALMDVTLAEIHAGKFCSSPPLAAMLFSRPKQTTFDLLNKATVAVLKDFLEHCRTVDE